MPSFKPKPVKTIKVSKNTLFSLDTKHNDFISQFDIDENEILPKLQSELYKLNKILLSTSNNNIECEMNIRDKIRDLKQEIHVLEKRRLNYYLDNSQYIFDYFENKKSISQGETPNKNKMLNNFFKIKTENNSIEPNKIEKKNKNIFFKYLSNIDKTFIDTNDYLNQSDICSYCHKGEYIPMDDEGILMCNVCYSNKKYLIENDKPSCKDPPKEICFYAYKKINHFKEILAQFQGKETTMIPDTVIQCLRNQIKKERICIESLTYNDTKVLLKKLGYNKYYEHINFIKDKLGILPPIISQELEDTLCNFFMEIQYPYARHCPDYRVNFLHYYYVLYKLFELLNETSYLKEIPMLKDRDKLIEQDIIWRKICEELDWKFIPTI
jgi:hypothetical protein